MPGVLAQSNFVDSVYANARRDGVEIFDDSKKSNDQNGKNNNNSNNNNNNNKNSTGSNANGNANAGAAVNSGAISITIPNVNAGSGGYVQHSEKNACSNLRIRKLTIL